MNSFCRPDILSIDSVKKGGMVLDPAELIVFFTSMLHIKCLS